MSKRDQRVLTDREAAARAELGHTKVTGAVKAYLIGMFITLILAVPGIQLAAEWARGQRPVILECAHIPPEPGDAGAALEQRGFIAKARALLRINADMLRRIEQTETLIEDESVVVGSVAPMVQAALTPTLGAATEDAYPGRGSWLFYRPGIDYLTGPGFLDPDVLAARRRAGSEWQEPPHPDPLEALLAFNAQLAARGIALVVVPAPAKAMLHPERFTSRYSAFEGVLQNPSYPRFAEVLEESGIRVFDAAAVLAEAKSNGGEPLFLVADTHWTPSAMQCTAEALAEFLREEGLVQKGTAVFEHRRVTVRNQGDVARMLRLPDWAAAYPEEETVVEQVLLPGGGPWESDPNSEVLLLGDSYVNVYSMAAMGWGESAGFAEHLSAALGTRIDVIRVNDNGAYATRLQLRRELEACPERLAGKRVVVYEFAIRELAAGDWKPVILPGARP